MIRSRPGAVFAVLLAALAAAPSAPRAQADPLAAERHILVDVRDPDAAAAFLADKPLQARLRGEDESGYLALFRAATELTDLRELLRGFEQEPRVIRSGLESRPDCSFCQNVPELESWAAQNRATPGAAVLSGILFDWDTLPDARRTWLAQHGATPDSWAATPFLDREMRIGQWARARYEVLMKENPSTPAEVDALRADVDEVDDALNHDDSYALGVRVDQADSAVTGLADVEKRLASSTNPMLLAALTDARTAPDLETRLAKLALIFDGLGEHNADVAHAAPIKAGQGFDPTTRRLVAEELGPALMKEIAGTWAGADLKAFYAKTPLKITIGKEDSALATYADGKINFGESAIEEFLKDRNRSARDLAKDAALLHDLVREVASVFVHEATHHRQDVWRQQLGIRDSYAQYGEIEAMETEALYTLQKSSLDPSYKKYLERAAKTSTNARESLSLAERLEQNGASYFRASIRAWYYPGKLSLEGESWTRIARDDGAARDVKAELARRAALPKAQAAALEKGPDLDEEYDDRAKFAAAMKKAGTPQLSAYLAEQDADEKREPQAYELHRARFAQVNRLTEQRLKLLAAGASAPQPDAVPSPGGGPG